MATDLEKKATEAFIDDHFELAVDLYSQAIDLSPDNAELYADRAQANIKLENFTEAVADANRAIELEPSMAKAYLRKGVACIKFEEYQTAKTALQIGAGLAPQNSRFSNLIKECDERIAEENGCLSNHSVEKAPTSSASTTAENKTPATNGHSAAISTTTSAKPKFRHEFYQKPEEVVVTIFAKGIPAKNVSVVSGEQTLSVTIDVPGEEPYRLQLRLFGKIKGCRHEVLSTKVEIRLAKAELIHWTSLEYSKEPIVPQRINVASAAQKPSYPSSKNKVDWDKVEAEVKKQEKEEKLEGDAALNDFFQKLYGDADEDTRRAMMKSFVESNGTVLSTNWKEVGAKKIEGSAPDGMEMKKWEY